MADAWQPIAGAPKCGRVISVASHDWGRKDGTVSTYRARWFKGGWINVDVPGETLQHCFEWREAQARTGVQQLLDGLPIASVKVSRGVMVQALTAARTAEARGDLAGVAEMTKMLAQAVLQGAGVRQ